MYKNCDKAFHPIYKQHRKLNQDIEKKPVEPIKKTYDNIKNQVESNAPIRHK